MAFEIDNDIVGQHVRIVLNNYFDDVFETSEYYNIRCNVCGDSTKDKYKKRGFILTTKDPWVYYCHNCGISTTAIKWMKEYFPVNYKNMMIDIMRNKKDDGTKNYNFKRKKGSSERDEKEDTKYFKRLTKFPDCVKYCEDRNIPKDVYSQWMYATGGVFFGRIIITFRKPNGKIYYYQGRSFNNKAGVKYLSRFGDHKITIYNYYNVDVNKPVPILEGPIDSIFVDNSIAVTGLKLKSDALDKFPKKYFLLDNDKSANKKVHKLLKSKEYVFNWTKFLKDYRCDGDVKDVNDFINKNNQGIVKLTWDIIGNYFTNKIGDKIYFPIKKENKK